MPLKLDPLALQQTIGNRAQSRLLPAPFRHRMEAEFAADFSAVRIHEGHQATHIGALAYTQGTDIHFAPGAYEPCTPRGEALLAHELTHVVQQRTGRIPSVPQGMVNVPSDSEPESR